MKPAAADLAAELNALADASAAALALLREGDEGGVAELCERRERLLGALAGWPLDARPEIVEAALRALALDTEIVALLEERKGEVGGKIARLTRARQSLSSYGPARPPTPSYLERLS
jgi:hypothetical protein